SAGATYVIGKVFIQHFASGGTLLDFNPPDYREFIKAQKEKLGTSSAASPPSPLPPRGPRQARARGSAVLDLGRVGAPYERASAQKRDRDVMTLAVIVIIYVVFCILTGLCGSQRRMGFFGTFIISLFITPIVMLILLKLTA